MIEINDNMPESQRTYLSYWTEYLKDVKNMSGNAKNFKELFKAIDKLESAIVKESEIR